MRNVAAAGVTRLMTSLLYQVRPDDAWTFFAVAGLAALATFAACIGPAFRAASVDPIVALREDYAKAPDLPMGRRHPMSSGIIGP